MSDSPSPRDSFFAFTTSRPVAIVMIVSAVLLFGFLSYEKLALDLMPDITYPSLTVRTEYSGAAPEEVETAISRPTEEALGVVTNLVSISSVSKAGQSDVILEFNWDADMNEAINEVREKLDRVFLPEDAEKPLILKFDPSLDPIMRLGLTGGPDLFYLRYVAEEQIKRELETVDGVASVKVKGGYEEEIRVELNEQQITLLNLDIQQIRQRLAAENVNLAGGELKEGPTEYIVRTLNEFRSIDEIAEIRLTFANNRMVQLRDIGRVYRTYKERQIITRLNGEESVELEIYKEGDANIVEVARNVRDKIFGSAEQHAMQEQLKQMEAMARLTGGGGKPEPAQPDTSAQDGDSAAVAEDKPRGGPGGGGQAFAIEMMKRRATDYLMYRLPGDLNLELLTDQSVFIQNSIDEVKDTAILGGILAIIVLFLFLNNVSTTVIVGVAIPVSIVATFAPMNLFGVTLNIMSLGGLALGIGMLVDNSIVVTESIFRCREEGDDLVQSVIRGTSEVGGAVTASTLTTIAVFFPMVFVEGVAGQVFGDLAVTVVFSLLASLGAALFFIPMLASRRFDVASLPTPKESIDKFIMRADFARLFADSFKGGWRRFRAAGFLKKLLLIPVLLLGLVYIVLRFILHLIFTIIGRLWVLVFLAAGLLTGAVTVLWKRVISPALSAVTRRFEAALNWLTGYYEGVIRWALANTSAVLVFALAPFLVVLFLIFPRLGSELIPEVRQGEFNVELTLPIGTPVETTAELVGSIESFIADQPEVEKLSTVAGIDLTKISDSESGEHTAKITVTLHTEGESPAEVEDRVLGRIRSHLEGYSGIAYKISRPVLFSFRTPIEVEIKGYNLSQMSRVSREAVRELSQVPGLTDVKTNLQRGNPEVQIIYDRTRLAYYGLNVEEVANLVRNKVRGDVATQFKKEDRRIDIRVKVREEDKATLARLRRLNVNPREGVAIPLESVASIEINEGPSEIRRINQERSAVILANLADRDLSSVSEDVFQAMQSLSMPEDFTFDITGQNKEMEVSLNSLQLALILAIFMVYIVMASQFESFVHPLVILFSVPFALIGVALVLFAMGIPLNIMVFLGFIMLAGIVVNNAIVLVDYINQLRRRGMAKAEAIVQAGKARLRPILMTTTTTVLGLLPMALGLGEGAEIRTPMAITVIAGLISSTVLTLVVIPTVYSLFERKETLAPKDIQSV